MCFDSRGLRRLCAGVWWSCWVALESGLKCVRMAANDCWGRGLWPRCTLFESGFLTSEMNSLTSADYFMPLNVNRAGCAQGPTKLCIFIWPALEDWPDYILRTALLTAHQVTTMGKNKTYSSFLCSIISWSFLRKDLVAGTWDQSHSQGSTFLTCWTADPWTCNTTHAGYAQQVSSELTAVSIMAECSCGTNTVILVLSGFAEIDQDDQIRLIKQGSFEVMLARFSLLVNDEDQTMLDPTLTMRSHR